ncbi:MAG: tyrosine-protein phosphatase [Gemmatimonadota bacterium]
MNDPDPTALADIHSHLVPGVDDGARTVEDVLESVERMTRLGIRKILTTPHLDGSLTQDPEELEERLSEVDEAFAEAAQAVGERFPEVDFRRGHEVMLDVPYVSFDDPRVRLAGTSFVLVEWPRLQLPPGTVPVIEHIRADGYKPIIAHPERYIGMGAALGLAQEWRDQGAYLQVNYGSLVGRYGGEARSTAFRLLRRGWADYIASDFHGRPGISLYKQEAWTALEEVGGHEALVHLCLTNPSRVFRDEDPIPVPLLPAERGFWARVKEILRTGPR